LQLKRRTLDGVHFTVTLRPTATALLRSSLKLPCWQVRWDHQVGLDLNLGTPRMELIEPRVPTAKSSRLRALQASRRVRLHGTHWLWLAPEVWMVNLADGTTARRTSSSRQCSIATARLTGERLVGLEINTLNGTTRFFFDLGAVLSAVRPRGWGHPEDGELWSLHGPRRRYVAVFASGRYTYGIATKPDPVPVPILPQGARSDYLRIGSIPA
jgi:hypothetical protein